MKKFVHRDMKPIGGYKFVDPDTGFVFGLPYKTFEDLEDHVRAYRSQNNMPMIDRFRMVWEAYICANTPGMDMKCCSVEEKIARNFKQYWNGAKAFVKSTFLGDEAFVEKSVADERAAKCIDCSENIRNIGHSQGQFYSDKFINMQIAGRRSDHHEKLHTCRVCTCILKAKVFYKDSVVAESLSESEIGALTRQPRSIKTGKRFECWQLTAALKESEDG